MVNWLYFGQMKIACALFGLQSLNHPSIISSWILVVAETLDQGLADHSLLKVEGKTVYDDQVFNTKGEAVELEFLKST